MWYIRKQDSNSGREAFLYLDVVVLARAAFNDIIYFDMADILHDFLIKAQPEKVFDSVSTPEGLEKWWAKTSSGSPLLGNEYQLGFGHEYQWKALVTKCSLNSEFELLITKADVDWEGSKVGFGIKAVSEGTKVHFAAGN